MNGQQPIVMKYSDIAARLKDDGFIQVRTRSGHERWSHPKKGLHVTIPNNKKEIAKQTLKDIHQQAGWLWKGKLLGRRENGNIHMEIRDGKPHTIIRGKAVSLKGLPLDQDHKDFFYNTVITDQIQLARMGDKEAAQKLSAAVSVAERAREKEKAEKMINVALYAEKHGVKAAASHFKIKESIVVAYCEDMGGLESEPEPAPVNSEPEPAAANDPKPTQNKPRKTKRFLSSGEAVRVAEYMLNSRDRVVFTEVAKVFDISHGTACNIARGVHWRLPFEWREKMAHWFGIGAEAPTPPPPTPVAAPVVTPPDDERWHGIIACLAEVCVKMYGADPGFLRRFLKMSADVDLPLLEGEK